MAATPSNMIPLGSKAPDFELTNTLSDSKIKLSAQTPKKATVIMFICNHCPYVKLLFDEIVKVGNDYLNKEVSFFAISSNDVVNYPQDSPEKMKVLGEKINMPFPYLYDETQEVAKAYEAACTPDFYVFNEDMECVYRGQFDEARPGNGKPVTGQDLRKALDDILEGKSVSFTQIPSIGCNIKWKA